ncbi:MAG: hypothetical protein OXI01_23335 [Albidovulum sp.]|nr:hypothetical protein [Albidovulum sp.]
MRTFDDVFAPIEDRELRAELKSIHAQPIRIQLEHLLIRSPILLVFTALAQVFILIGVVRGGIPALLRWLARIADAANCRDFSGRSAE